jgi:hypothetical protein
MSEMVSRIPYALSRSSVCARPAALSSLRCAAVSRGGGGGEEEKHMGRLGDRFPLGSIGYGPVLGGYLGFFLTVGSGP